MVRHCCVPSSVQLKTEVNAGQEELKGQLKANMSAVTAGQEELKGQLKADMCSDRRPRGTQEGNKVGHK
jgi:hypothetical protein